VTLHCFFSFAVAAKFPQLINKKLESLEKTMVIKFAYSYSPRRHLNPRQFAFPFYLASFSLPSTFLGLKVIFTSLSLFWHIVAVRLEE